MHLLCVITDTDAHTHAHTHTARWNCGPQLDELLQILFSTSALLPSASSLSKLSLCAHVTTLLSPADRSFTLLSHTQQQIHNGGRCGGIAAASVQFSASRRRMSVEAQGNTQCLSTAGTCCVDSSLHLHPLPVNQSFRALFWNILCFFCCWKLTEKSTFHVLLEIEREKNLCFVSVLLPVTSVRSSQWYLWMSCAQRWWGYKNTVGSKSLKPLVTFHILHLFWM